MVPPRLPYAQQARVRPHSRSWSRGRPPHLHSSAEIFISFWQTAPVFRRRHRVFSCQQCSITSPGVDLARPEAHEEDQDRRSHSVPDLPSCSSVPARPTLPAGSAKMDNSLAKYRPKKLGRAQLLCVSKPLPVLNERGNRPIEPNHGL